MVWGRDGRLLLVAHDPGRPDRKERRGSGRGMTATRVLKRLIGVQKCRKCRGVGEDAMSGSERH